MEVEYVSQIDCTKATRLVSGYRRRDWSAVCGWTCYGCGTYAISRDNVDLRIMFRGTLCPDVLGQPSKPSAPTALFQRVACATFIPNE